MTACDELVGQVLDARQLVGSVVENETMARDTWRLRLRCPEIARQITPGQFFMVRDPRVTDPMLGRPFALFDVWNDDDGQPLGVDLGYLVVGKMTTLMTSWRAGDPVEIWGPLGNGFPVPDCQRLLMVAGGIGQTPFLAVGREVLGTRTYGKPARTGRTTQSAKLLYGARSQEYLAGLDRFEAAGIPVAVSTDDGSAGHAGFVTDLLRAELGGDSPPDAIYSCGPEPMMAAVAKIAADAGVPCWLSLETPMACGFGICFSCVTEVRMDDGSADYRRTCVEGPVFRAEKLCLS
ncbi:MAG: dihydroorotate dehydrogenase electron transfer subunit [Planctomycetota bacterium]|jgi:dihydroorotate dehydrogenase electron transfer subunit